MNRTISINLAGLALVTLAVGGCPEDEAGASGSETGIDSADAVGSTGGGTGDSTTSAGSMTGDATSAGVTTQSPTTGQGGSTGEGTTTGAEDCEEGQIICQGSNARVCDGMGGFSSTTNCDPQMCIPDFGCGQCIPEETRCVGESVEVCTDDGGWEFQHTCDPVQGSNCDMDAGACTGSCAPELLGDSYFGCDYYPTVTAGVQSDPWDFNFGVIVANSTNAAATITVTQGAATLLTAAVPANSATVVTLPWDDELSMPTGGEEGPSRIVTEGAYRLRTDRPVGVYQYNPLEYIVPGNCDPLAPIFFTPCISATNDASLLLPTNTWGTDYMVVSRNHWIFAQNTDLEMPGFYAVVATQDNTTVTTSPSASGGAVFAGDGIAADGTGTVVLNDGDVLQVVTVADGPVGSANPSDLTGTIISADRPVQVFGGHKCTNVPSETQWCDRLEESMLPMDTLASEYLVVAPQRADGSVNDNVVRITATQPNTTLTYDPAQAGAPAMITNVGDFVEVDQTNESFLITASESVMVAQYIVGQGCAEYDIDGSCITANPDPGDPSMLLGVPSAQYRDNYLIHAPTNYLNNFVNITAPMDANVTVDGNAIPALSAIGASGFGFARIELDDGVQGNHAIEGDQAFGVSVYGYGDFTSFWYPGGMDLAPLPQ